MQKSMIEILLIEDNLPQAELIKEMLSEARQQEFSVQHVQSLAAGLSLLRSRDFDVVLVDLGLPDSQGLETALAVRNQSEITPVVALTVLNDEDTALKSLQMDIQDYLIKGEINSALLTRSIRYAIQRKRDVDSLRESENHYRTLFNTIIEGFCIIEVIFDEDEKPIDYRFLEINPSFEKQTGLIGAQGKRMRELAPKHEEHWFETYGKIALTGQPVCFQSRADQLLRWYDVYAFRFGQPENRQVAILFYDITERKQAEDEIQRVASFPLMNPNPVLELNADGQMIFCNPAAKLILENAGYNNSINPLIPQDMTVILQDLRDKKAGQYFQEAEINGSFFEELVYIAPQYQSVRIYTMDITERKRAEEALRKSELKFFKIFHSVPALIGITTLKEGRVVDVNETTLRTLGYRRDEVIGRTVNELNVWEDATFRPRVLHALEEQGSIKNLEIRFNCKSGKTFTGLLSAEAIDLNGERYILSMVNDITERKRMEEVIERLNTDLTARAAELEDANSELEAFNYTVAHDLRKPLTVINGYCQILREVCSDKLDEECRRYIQETYDGTWRMNRLIDALLQFSSMAQVEPRRKTVNFSAMAHEVAEELKRAEPERHVSFRIPSGIVAEADQDLLRVVLANLFGNAWKYTSNREEGVIEFNETEVEGTRAYFVRDNGIGFDPTNAGILFAPFQRLEEGKEFGGLGIGLATVARIIQRHGGEVWAEGEPGKGATFWFTLGMEKVATN